MTDLALHCLKFDWQMKVGPSNGPSVGRSEVTFTCRNPGFDPEMCSRKASMFHFLGSGIGPGLNVHTVGQTVGQYIIMLTPFQIALPCEHYKSMERSCRRRRVKHPVFNSLKRCCNRLAAQMVKYFLPLLFYGAKSQLQQTMASNYDVASSCVEF